MPVAVTSEVLITGIGVVSPLGIGRQATWEGLMRGDLCGRELDEASIDHFQDLCRLLKRPPIGAPVRHDLVASAVRDCWPALFPNSALSEFEATWGQDCLNNMVAACAQEAVLDAGLTVEQLAGPSSGCVLGTSKPSLRALESGFVNRRRPDVTSAEFLWHSGFMPDSPLRMLQSLFRIEGPFGCPVAACATGLHSFLEAAALVANGQCDVCLAGSGDASLRSSVLAGFHRLGVASRNRSARTAGKPFDSKRDGFVIGEGAAVMVLESAQHASRRKARAYGRLQQGRILTDCTGITQIDTSGAVVARLVDQLGDIRPDLMSLHGTGTRTNDLAEASGLGPLHDRLGAKPPAFSIKGAIGHTLGAAASIELAVTCLALANGRVPPTANLRDLDPDCDVRVSDEPRSLETSETALKLSLGFGGHVAGCVIQACD